MAQSPFDSNHALFLLFGLTDDQFCLPDTRLVDLPTYLDIHLRSTGFKQLAFHHPLDGVRITGAPPEPKPSPSSQPVPRASAGKSLASGPLGQMKVLSPQAPEPPRTVQSEPQTYDKMTDAELPSFIESFFEGDERQAFIFEDLEYLMDFNPQALAILWALLRRIHTQNTGRKKIIFLSNSQSIETLKRDRGDRHFLSSLGDQFFHGDAVAPNVVRIGAPGTDEILSLQRRFRLRDHVLTNFSSLVQNCETNAAELREESLPLASSLRNNIEPLRSYDWTKEEKTESALIRLEALPGRRTVAERIRGDVDYAQHQQANGRAEDEEQRDQRPAVGRLLDHSDEKPPAQVNLSYALAGKPGTGKTIIARLVAEAFKEAGILRSGHFIEATVQDLVGEYVGQSALKANNLLSRARGGVLFIDEVQGFEKDNQFHREAIRTILKYAEDYRGDISVIVATYPDEMDAFLSIDPGLPRRFSQRIDLEDYDAATCVDIFNYIAAEKKVEVDSDLQEKLEGLFEAWINDRTKKEDFSNAGSVRNLVEAMDRARFNRGGSDAPLSLKDVPEDYQAYSEAAIRRTGDPDERLEYALKELNALTGLGKVKEAVQKIVDGIKVAQMTGQEAKIVPGHYSFEGNPGTGKTTVARLLGHIFRELGVLKSDRVVEVMRSDFVGRYQGHTGRNVQEIADRAMDGVLFIDEAHNLIKDENDTYGREAIGALTPILENERGRLCVIVAGYSAPMERLFAVDPGWKSRFTHENRIQFDDFEPQEMEQILRQMCKGDGFKLHSDLDHNLPSIMARLREVEGDDFANGRSVRNFFNTMVTHRNRRLIANKDDVEEGKIDPFQLILEDVPEALRL